MNLEDPLENEDSLQFFKEEKVEGAIYNVYLKKVRYHTPSDVRIDQGSSRTSVFYRSTPLDDDEDDTKARLQFRTISVHSIKCGTVARLVEMLSSDTGELDSSYVNIFLATYRAFTTPKHVMNLILDRYKEISEDSMLKQRAKEAHRKTLRIVISIWLDNYPADFHDPPNYTCLHQLLQFAATHIPGSDLAQRAHTRLHTFRREDEDPSPPEISVDDIEMNFNWLEELEFQTIGSLPRPVEFFNVPIRIFAEQLTYVDAELFKKVVPHQCLGSVWSRRDKKGNLAPSVFATVQQFNVVSYRVISTVLKRPFLSSCERALVIEKWILIAQELRVLKNFSSLKAIISGLRSNPVYRLKKVWAEVNSEMMELFDELSEVFSEANNQMMVRELLMKEGTAKFADPETTSIIKGNPKRKSIGFGTLRGRNSVRFEAEPNIVQGTVPYLGTFLSDLTMIDAAISDNTAEGLVNFDKRRKEFEVLAQIRLLQSAATLYNIKPDQAFYEWFFGVRVYDDNESYELSCEIDPVTPTTPKEVRGHRKKSSLGFFSPRRPPEVMSLSSPNLNLDHTQNASTEPTNTQTLDPPRSRPNLRHSISVNSLKSLESSVVSLSPWKSPETCVVKVILETADCDSSNMYKSILLSNSDHTRNVVRNILLKFNVEGLPDDYLISQILPDSELQIPEKSNVFYAINNTLSDIKFIVRKKSDMERLKSKRMRKTKYKFTL